MSMFESAERVSAMNSNLYKGDTYKHADEFPQNFPPVPQATSSYPPTTGFNYGFASGSRLPLTDPRSLEGLPVFIYQVLLFLADLSIFRR